MIDAQLVLGMPLAQALCLAGEEAASIRVVHTAAPRRSADEGTLRVIRVRPGEWVVSAFMDGMPADPNA